MTIVGIILFLTGLLLSAFFSGSETGFYRVTRVRLVMDAKSGSWIAQCLLWLIAFPSLQVATVLIGNNLANYLVSLGLLIASQTLFQNLGESVTTLMPVLATPLLFIYGELLPKYLYFNASYLLSTRGAPFMLVCTVLFLPVSLIVMAFEFVLQRLVGQSNVRMRFSLERQELQRVMMEGQEAGILLPVQREMSQNLFIYGVRQVRHFATPLRAIALVKKTADIDEILEVARRRKQRVVGVLSDNEQELIGCYQVSDLILGRAAISRTEDPQRIASQAMLPVANIGASASNVQALSDLQNEQCPVAQIRESNGAVIGIVSRARLTSLLLPTN